MSNPFPESVWLVDVGNGDVGIVTDDEYAQQLKDDGVDLERYIILKPREPWPPEKWKCPMCAMSGFDDKTLGPHIKEMHPISDEEWEALDDAEVAGPLEGGPLSPELEKAFKEMQEEWK